MDMKKTLMKGLKSMKIAKKASSDLDVPVKMESESYPYGLRIDLNKDSLKKLGLSVAQFTVGEQVKLECQADVISLRSSKGRYDDSENVELQITMLGFEED